MRLKSFDLSSRTVQFPRRAVSFYQWSARGIMDPLHPRIDSRACLRPPSGSVSTEAGEKTKWVVQCRRNGREISVNYRVEPFRGWDECEVFVTRHRSRLLFLVLNINNPAPSFSPPPPPFHPLLLISPLVSRHPMNCAAGNRYSLC